MVVKEYYFKKLITDDVMKTKEGNFFDDKSYHTIINHDADVYMTDDDGVNKILFYYRKNVLFDNLLKNAISVFKKDAMKGSSIRGKAGGVINKSMISSNVANIVSPDNFRSKVIYKDGKISDYYISNKVNSLIAGYFDKPKLSEKSDIIKNNAIQCRTTSFTEKNFDNWKTVIPLIKKVDNLYSKLDNDHYCKQRKLANLTPDYIIDDTVFSTMTVNYNWRTACHIDSGDYRDGLSVIIVAEEGEYEGGYLGYPQYGVCVDVRHGDFLLKDPHQYHCNTEIIGITSDYTRLSMIFYYRESIQKCNKNIKDVIVKGFEEYPLNIMIRPDTTDIKVIDEVLIRNVYENKKLGFYINKDECWLDLGGNIGTFSLLCLLKGASIITYEPEPENFGLLLKNIKLNFPEKLYELINKSVGITDGMTDLYICKGDYNKYRHTIYKKRGRTSIKVPIESMMSIFNKFKNITCIKMDIEGAEIDILENLSLSDWEKSKVKKLVFEYSFDIDSSIPRFLSIIKNLRLYFNVVHYTKVKENEEHYKYFPAMTMVYCIRKIKLKLK